MSTLRHEGSSALHRHTRRFACAAALLGLLGPSVADACAPGETQRYQSQWAIWCIDDGVWAKAQGKFETVFFPYGDAVVQELELLFGVTPAGLPLIIEATEPNGYAQTPPACCGNGCDQNPCLGESVTGDAYYNNAYGVDGYWGYLLTLHELVNQWTGYVSSGWPTDFWADHISAFPNSMDWQIMDTLGTKLGNPTLTAAAAAQKARFYPGGDNEDPRVPMFDQIFALPTMGYAGWTRIFGFIKNDEMSWDGLGVQNPDKLRTEYVIAYTSLGAGQSVLSIMQAADVANGISDGFPDDAIYTGSQDNIDAIATAHCAIAAAAAQGLDVTADRAALKSGNFAGVTAAGTCGQGCPAECACKESTNNCVAPWLGDSLPDPGTTTASTSGDPGTSGGSSTSSTTSGGNGTPTTGGADNVTTTTTNNDSSSSSASGGAQPDGSSSGCSCNAPDSSTGHGGTTLLAVAALALAFTRTRRR